MPLIAEDLRIEMLRQLGCSTPLVKLADGECLHKIFRSSCLGPPVYHRHARIPQGPIIAPLWDDAGRVYGLRRSPKGLEFLRFSIEDPDGIETIASSEQGFLAHRFDFCYENDASLDDLREAAGIVEFRFVEMYLQSRDLAEERLGTFKAHSRWLGQLVEDIDRQSLQGSRCCEAVQDRRAYRVRSRRMPRRVRETIPARGS